MTDYSTDSGAITHRDPAATVVVDSHSAQFTIQFSICFVAAVGAYGLFVSHGLAPSVVGYNLVPAERVLNGEVPYRDFLYNYTPGVPWFNALLFEIGGVNLLAARTGVFAAKVATAVAVFLLARRVLPGWLALLPVAMTLAWIGYGDVLKVFPTQYGMPLLIGACLAVIRSSDTQRARSRTGWLVIAGGLAGLVLVFKQNVGVFALVATCITALLLRPVPDERRVSRISAALTPLLLLIVGFAGVVGLMFLYLAIKSGLGPMLSHFARHATAYSEERGIPLPRASLLLASATAFLAAATGALLIVRVKARGLSLYFGAVSILFAVVVMLGDSGVTERLYRSLVATIYYLPLLLLIICAAVFGRNVLNASSPGRYGNPAGKLLAGGLTAAILVFSLASFLEIFPRSDADHLVRMLPPSFVLLCALSFDVDRRLRKSAEPGNIVRHTPAVALSISLVVTLLGIRVTWAPQFESGLHFVESYPLEFDRGRHTSAAPSEAQRMNEVVGYIQSHTASGQPILSLSRKMSGINFFADRPNTTKLVWFDSAGIADSERSLVENKINGREFKLILTLGEYIPQSDTTTEGVAYDRAMRLVEANYKLQSVVRDVNLYGPKD
ncbi:MAG TPA: glycosyltransferase family 39 protein [Blastocatellia bacterium]|nr:glycosyltransferase family 39 protein [Blastocatellia bacterium]